jgi:hypothetical protein
MRLRALRFPVWLCPSPRVIELAAAMPSLRTLSFASLGNEDPAIDLFAPLVRATQLSSLELHFGWCSPPPALSLQKLSWLRDLKLRGALFGVNEFPLLFGPTDDGLPGLSQLESLSLGGFNMRLPPYNDPRFLKLDLEAALVCMSRLHTLTLSFVGFINDALQALMASSSLRQLIVHLRPQSGCRIWHQSSFPLPTVSTLQALLGSNMYLHIRIHCAKTKREWLAHGPAAGDVRASHHSQYRGEHGMPSRVAFDAGAVPSEPFALLSALVSDRLHLLDELAEHRVPPCQYQLAQPLGVFGHTPSPGSGVILAREQARLEREREMAEMMQRAFAGLTE